MSYSLWRIVLSIGLATFCLPSVARAQAYGMSFSVYTNPSVSSDGLNLVVM